MVKSVPWSAMNMVKLFSLQSVTTPILSESELLRWYNNELKVIVKWLHFMSQREDMSTHKQLLVPLHRIMCRELWQIFSLSEAEVSPPKCQLETEIMRSRTLSWQINIDKNIDQDLRRTFQHVEILLINLAIITAMQVCEPQYPQLNMTKYNCGCQLNFQG